MMGLMVCETPDADARVYLLLDRGGLPVYVAATIPDAYLAVLDRGEDEIAYYTLRGPEVYRIVEHDPDRLPRDGGPFSCVRLLHADLDDVPPLPVLGFIECPEHAIGPQRPWPPTPKQRRRKPR